MKKELIRIIEKVYDTTKDRYAREYIRKELRDLGVWEKPSSIKKLPVRSRFSVFLADFKTRFNK